MEEEGEKKDANIPPIPRSSKREKVPNKKYHFDERSENDSPQIKTSKGQSKDDSPLPIKKRGRPKLDKGESPRYELFKILIYLYNSIIK